MCKTGQCIKGAHICDNEYNCFDKHDENCFEYSKQLNFV